MSFARLAKKYTVTYARDRDGWWTASIDRAQGASVVTQGRSLFEARKRIREALALDLDVSVKAVAAIDLVDDIKLSAGARVAVRRALRARTEASAAQERSIAAATAAARALTSAGLSTRDAAEVLGVSHQLVHNHVKKGPASLASRPGAAKRSAKARFGEERLTSDNREATVKRTAAKRSASPKRAAPIKSAAPTRLR